MTRPPSRDRSRLRARLSRLPLRARLVAGFTAAMTVVLLAAGAFIYWRVEYALDRRLDTDLTAEAQALRILVQPDGTLRTDQLTAAVPGISDHQVLDRNGRVLSAGAGLGASPLLSADIARAAVRGPVYADVGPLLPVSKRPLRLLATPIDTSGQAAVLVVGVGRDERDEALRELLGQLSLAGLGALLVTAAVGDRLAKAALAPVERFRARAQDVATGATGVRLDVPPGRDDEVTRLGHTLNDMLDALADALARERRFLDDASHELRTPLTVLSTRVQLALRRPRSVAEHEAVLRELHTDVAGLADLAERLLQIGAAAGSPSPDRGGSGDLARVVTELTPAGEDAPGSRLPATWTVDLAAPAPVLVPLPDAAIRQVLLNLLTNAAAHGAPPVQVGVRVAATSSGAVAVLTVADNGTGVPPDFLPTAAERFSRADTARGRPGAGLGLSLVHDLVRRYDGELRLCSRGVHHRFEHRFDVDCRHHPEGTTATVLLPSPR